MGGPRTGAPAPYFRRAFALAGEVREARLAITALGLYECEINGRRVGDHVLAPGWTDYRRRVAFQIYDVTGFLRSGGNALGVILGDGWYCGHIAWADRQTYGDRPQLLAQLEITLADGSHVVVATDAFWLTARGPILENDPIAGESYDARLELPGWSEPGCDESAWQAVLLAPSPDIILEPSVAPPVRCVQELAPVAERSLPFAWPKPGRLFDFGQNFCGRVRIAVEAARGTTLMLRYAEMLNPNGTLYTENLRTARVTDHYTCKGGGPEIWEPRFTFHGFRYASIAGLLPGDTLSATGLVLHSDTPATGSFSCSHPLLNRLQQNIVWGQKSNFLEVPMDCPQRDERLGWTGDAQVFIRTAAFNMDVCGFFHKWMQDIRDAQTEDGAIPSVAPNIGVEPRRDGGPAWADATIICPWTIYLCYGDRKILEDHYESMVRFMDFLAAHCCRAFIRSHPDLGGWPGFGDWLALDGSGKNEGGTPKDLIGTAFYAHAAELMAKIAGILGRGADAGRFGELHGKVVRAFQERFVAPEGLLVSGTQTAYVLALYFDLLPEGLRATAARELVRNIERNGFHLATGFVGTPYLLEVLETHGYLDVAYRLLEQESFPSWLFPLRNGATTIWERWDGWTPEKGFQTKSMNSFNHYAYGAVGAWMYRSVAGLELDPEQPGYRHVIFRPRPGGSLTWAKAALRTPYGETAISWDMREGGLDIELLVPEKAHATFSPPPGYGGDVSHFEAGTHRFALEKESGGS